MRFGNRPIDSRRIHAAAMPDAEFDPIGLRGLLYWFSAYPMHALVFAGMLHGFACAAEETARKE